jgi:amino acid transporter
MGPWGRALLLAGATVSMFGYLGGMTLSMPRMLYAFARDGFLPRILAAVHPLHCTPRTAIVVQSIATVILAATGSFEGLAILANVSALVLYLGCALAAWRLRAQAGASQGGVPLGRLAPPLACLVIAWLLTGLTGAEWLAFASCLAGGTVVFLMTRARRTAAAGAAA